MFYRLGKVHYELKNYLQKSWAQSWRERNVDIMLVVMTDRQTDNKHLHVLLLKYPLQPMWLSHPHFKDEETGSTN